MKIAAIVVRSLMGALFVFSSVTFLFKLFTPPETTGALKMFNDGLMASGYFMNLLKITELVCGLMFLSGRFVALASVVIAPIIVNILFVHIYLSPEGLPVAIVLVIANSFLAYTNWDKYKPLFESK